MLRYNIFFGNSLPFQITIFTVVLICFYHGNSAQSGPIVSTLSGEIEGVVLKSSTGRQVNVFLGIPYGTSEQRFSKAREITPWSGIFKANTNHAYCMQMERVPHQDEDCLKLNIWVPWNVSKYSAVMVWIHGDSYLAGSANQAIYNGANLATEENVIVISINYRLAMFGFLYLDLPEAPGNVGLMDQHMALRWIRLNIWRFGGDPNNVTLFGASAGASSIGLHLLIPSSRNLFKRAILQSGSSVAPWAYVQKQQALNLSLQLAELVNCPTDKRIETLNCLIQKDASELTAAANNLDFFDVCFGPVADGVFIEDDPVCILESRNFDNKKEILIGTIQHDAAMDLNIHFHTRPMQDNSSYTYSDLEIVALKSLESLSKSLGLELNTRFLTKVITLQYSNHEFVESSSGLRNEILHLTTDFNFLCPDEKMSENLASAGNSVYRYLFQHHKLDTSRLHWVGSVHYDELPLVFGNSLSNCSEFRNGECIDQQFSKMIMKLWANFARHGNPNIGLEKNNLFWPRFKTSSKKYLLMQHQPSVRIHYRTKICAFWNEFVPDLIKSLTLSSM